MLNAESIVAQDERDRAWASLVSDLNHALTFLRSAGLSNRSFALGLELPAEQPLIDAINAAAHARHKEKT